MQNGKRLSFVATLVCAAAMTAAAQNPSKGPVSFSKIEEVVSNWSADQHLWTWGNLPVSDANLAGLEQWLDANAPNWTIVLMQTARSQTFQNYRGMDAVEHAMGKQLANQTQFGQLKDSRTGESNGAFFILFLEERKFSYYGSDVFDKRALGESRWVGQLDRPAIAAMRNGRRIVDAVKDTVTSIESQLTRKIGAAEAAKKRAAIERQRAIEEARQLPAQITAEIGRIEKTVSDFRDRNAAATGDLVQLPLASWRGGSKAIADYAAADDATSAHRLADQIRREISGFQSGLEQWGRDGDQLERIKTRLDRLTTAPDVSAVQGHRSRAAQALVSARENHRIASSLYRNQIDSAYRAIDQAESEIAAWEAALRAEERRQQIRRNTLLISVAAGVLLIIVGLIFANRLRRPERDDARKTLRNWRDQLSGKFDRLFELMDRASIVVGPATHLESRGFEGTTLQLCEQSIKEVDELFIMSSATDHVMDRAGALIEPGSIWGRLVNKFSGRRYRRGIDLLGSTPIGFDRDQGLEAILEPARKINPEAASRSLLGDPESYEPFRMSFEELIAAYDKKQSFATETVDRLESCIDGLPLLQDELSAKLDDATLLGSELAEAAAGDGFFVSGNLNAKLIPAASKNLDDATAGGRADPVSAMEGPATAAERQLEAALRMGRRIEKVRGDDFMSVRETAGKLEAMSRQVRWIDERYAESSNQAEQLAELAIGKAVDAELDEFEDDLLRLKGRIANCVRLADRADSEVHQSIEEAATGAASARKSLAGKLGLPEDAVLSEENLSPFSRIDLARKELDAARGALDHGNIETAQEEFHEIERHLDEAAELVEQSEQIAGTHAERHSDLREKLDAAREDVPRIDTLLTELKNGYDREVLRFSTRIGQPVRGQDSIAESVEQARTRLDDASAALEKSAAAFKEGRLIAAGGSLERTGNEIGFARHQLALVEDQYSALKTAETENPEELATLNRRHADLASDVSDRRTTRPTIAQYNETRGRLQAIEAALSESRPNPFSASLELEKEKHQLNAIEQGIEADRALFDSATAAAREARQNLAESETRVRQARTDNIPDSPKLIETIDYHQKLVDHFEKVTRYLESDHGDWAAAHDAAASVSAGALSAQATIEKEIRAARAAADEIKRAATAISVLQSWRSSHLVSVKRKAGSDAFAQARSALRQGDYALARNIAVNARGAARQELSRAKSRERSAEQAAAARRRRSMSSSSSFGSSFGSSGGGFSSGGSSGFSSGSFSSGSGVSRSGW